MDLSIVPSHPDRAGGLGFLEHVPLALGPVVLAVSAVLASHWAHDVTYHGVDIPSLKMPAAIFLAGIAVLVLAPLSAFSGPLRRARRQALLDYGTLVGEPSPADREDAAVRSQEAVLTRGTPRPPCDGR